MTAPATITRTDTEIDPTTGEPRVSHIVARDKVTEAYFAGTPIEALCGHVFVPTRDGKQFPLCSRCVSVRERARPDQDPEGIEPA